ncbi:MAG: homoserine kinase [Xanthomonadales bacterium]|nr:homoserine kinase [Xanthomonadales bacterium]NIX14218.1 homoserine kinase [Xanthomonadales bacterium]
MDMNKALTVFAPASSGNLSVGFDALGLALSPMDGTLLGDIVELRHTGGDDWTLEASGPFADALPEDPEDNIVMISSRRFEHEAGKAGANIVPLHATLNKRLPVGSGLGSSASSIVATLVALNQYFDRPLNRPRLLQLMAEMEGSISGEVHIDNIAPCLMGGLRLCIPGSASQYGLPWPGHWRSVIAWPGSRLNTREARSVLPANVPRETVVAHGAQFARFVHELHMGDAPGAAECLVDLLAEPHRATLLPGFREAREALVARGALAVGISGSGPTIFAIVDDQNVAEVARKWLSDNYLQADRGFVHVCRADLEGARVVGREE